MQAKLKASEASAVQLKARTISLANEKARAEDDQTVTNISKEVADSISSKLDTCTGDLQQVFSEIAAATTQADLDQIGSNLRDTYAACEAAAERCRRVLPVPAEPGQQVSRRSLAIPVLAVASLLAGCVATPPDHRGRRWGDRALDLGPRTPP